MSFASNVSLHVAAAIFGIWHDVSGCGKSPTPCIVVCLSHDYILIYLAFLSECCQEDDSSLSCTV